MKWVYDSLPCFHDSSHSWHLLNVYPQTLYIACYRCFIHLTTEIANCTLKLDHCISTCQTYASFLRLLSDEVVFVIPQSTIKNGLYCWLFGATLFICSYTMDSFIIVLLRLPKHVNIDWNDFKLTKEQWETYCLFLE